MSGFQIRHAKEEDRPEVVRILKQAWSSPTVVDAGRIYEADMLPALAAELGGQVAGLVTYSIEGAECSVVSLNSLHEGIGIGTALLDAVRGEAEAAGCKRMRLTTTNDNMHALRFYQRRGWTLAALYRNSIAKARKIKKIPKVGKDGIPLRDELELELMLKSGRARRDNPLRSR